VRSPRTIKIATFNINDVNKQLTDLLAWLKASKPDVVCLQQLKAAGREFQQDALAKTGYSQCGVVRKRGNRGFASPLLPRCLQPRPRRIFRWGAAGHLY
jgi:exonuclease III